MIMLKMAAAPPREPCVNLPCCSRPAAQGETVPRLPGHLHRLHDHAHDHARGLYDLQIIFIFMMVSYSPAKKLPKKAKFGIFLFGGWLRSSINLAKNENI